ncbi:MAG: DHH family phosphoesterase [Oscillospiraceae bacterium]
MNYKQCAKTLLGHENILILTHKNPDGDTMASAAALCSALRRGGRTACLYPNSQVNDKLRPFVEKFFAPVGYKYKYVVAVDIATEGLLPKGYEGLVNFCIDHHPTNSHYAGADLVRPEKSSCAEVVMELIQNINTEITKEEATLLYIGLSTDTGCFQYSNTNAASLRSASELLRLGADNAMVNLRFFRKVSRARLMLESMIYAGMDYYRDGKISVATVTLDMMEKAGATEDDCDDLAGLAGRAEDSVVSITIKEQEDGSCKISVRSNPEVSSSDICAVFGGGGHAMAAGCTIMGTPQIAKELLIQVIDEVWK